MATLAMTDSAGANVAEMAGEASLTEGYAGGDVVLRGGMAQVGAWGGLGVRTGLGARGRDGGRGEGQG